MQSQHYLSVTDDYKCVDIRSFYILYGLEDTPRNEKPTKSGIALRISDWVQFSDLGSYHRRYTSSTAGSFVRVLFFVGQRVHQLVGRHYLVDDFTFFENLLEELVHDV